jgi:hypothetical protein
MSEHAQFERNDRRRFAAEARAYDKLGKQLADADALIGEFVTGELYVNIRGVSGKLTGKIKRFTRRSDATHYLIRNRYV